MKKYGWKYNRILQLFIFYLPMLSGAPTNGVERQNDKWITNFKLVPVWKEVVVNILNEVRSSHTGNQRKTNILLMTTGLRGDQACNISVRYLILYKMKEG